MGVYERLGVKTIINGLGNGTSVGGSIMRPEVIAAMDDASRSYVRLPELLEKAGKRVAELVGVEAAYITAGAASGITVGVAACMTRNNEERVYQLPETSGMASEVVIQSTQENPYWLMVRLAGAKVVEANLAKDGGDSQLEASLNDRTAAIVHFVAYSPDSDLSIERVINIGKKHDVPVIVDAAAEFPPFSNLRRWSDMGADLTVFSGGKGICGPQSTGLVLGRQDLINACAINSSPNHGVGRPPKVGKEQIIGLVTALELYAKEAFQDSEMRQWGGRIDRLVEGVSHLPGLKAYSHPAPASSSAVGSGVAPEGIPVAAIEWDSNLIPKTPKQVVDELNLGDPPIVVLAVGEGIRVAPHTLEPGEESIIAERLSEILRT